MVVLEVVMVFMGLFTEDTTGNDGLCVGGIRAGDIQRNGVKGCEHTHIGNNRHVVFRMAVTAGRNIHHKADMEMGAILQDSQCVFRDLAVEDVIGLVICGTNRVLGANADAAAATDTLVVVDGCLLICNSDGIVGADLGAGTTAHAAGSADTGLARGVHLHLAGAGAAAHTDVLQRAAKAGSFVTLKVVQRNHDIRIHNRAADLCFLHIFAVNGDKGFICTL